MQSITESIKKRRSVRTFDGKEPDNELIEHIEDICRDSRNPFGISIRYVLIEKERYGVGSPVISGEKLYIAGIVRKEKDAEVAFGFFFEDVLLKLEAEGISGTIMAGFDEKAFSQAVALSDGERIACISPLGYKADRMSLRETLMRKAVGADKRLPLSRICYIRDLDHPAQASELGDIGPLLELVRLAPSAVNRQPWRMVIRDRTIHFYENHAKGMQGKDGWDIQKIDMGIALCHFYHGARESGLVTDCFVNDPHINVPEGTEYIVSMRIV
ncbi:MAG: nitroreductase [Clostridia bacterium]|nr:nitroreductase [Clostridia bacterium]